MTKFEMKKNELLEKGKEEGFILISDIVEIAKECKVNESEIKKFQEEITKLNIELVDRIPTKVKEKPKKVKEIKSFEERKEELIKKGKENGKVTYEELALALKGLEVDNDSLDELYNALIENKIDFGKSKNIVVASTMLVLGLGGAAISIIHGMTGIP